MTTLLPLASYHVLPAWVDYNHHMNDAAYALVFSRSVDALMDRAGLDAAGRARTGQTIYTLKLMVTYLREAKLGEEIAVAVRILERDARRLRLWLEMTGVDGTVLATCEQLLMCVMQGENGPRAASFVPEVAAALAQVAALHEGEALPEGAGMGVAMRRR